MTRSEKIIFHFVLFALLTIFFLLSIYYRYGIIFAMILTRKAAVYSFFFVACMATINKSISIKHDRPGEDRVKSFDDFVWSASSFVQKIVFLCNALFGPLSGVVLGGMIVSYLLKKIA